jgi:fatty acid amide hydrolase
VGAAASSRRKIGFLKLLLGLIGQPSTRAFIDNYGYRDTAHYWKLVEAQLDYRQRFREALDKTDARSLDLLICPAFALPALTHGASRDLVLAGAYTALYNVLGYPTGLVPFTKVRDDEEIGRAPSKDKVEQAAYKTELGSAGLPVGVQIVARPWQEHQALAAMSVIERVQSQKPDYPVTPVNVPG